MRFAAVIEQDYGTPNALQTMVKEFIRRKLRLGRAANPDIADQYEFNVNMDRRKKKPVKTPKKSRSPKKLPPAKKIKTPTSASKSPAVTPKPPAPAKKSKSQSSASADTSTKSARRRLEKASPKRTTSAASRPLKKRKGKAMTSQAPAGAKRARRVGPKEAGREAARGDFAGALGSDDDSTGPLPDPIEAELDGVSEEFSDNEGTMNAGSGDDAEDD
jgi:outer membrane biosynthesis protein TonB